MDPRTEIMAELAVRDAYAVWDLKQDFTALVERVATARWSVTAKDARQAIKRLGYPFSSF